MGTRRSWLRDTVAPWLRILTVSGDRSMTMEEKARLITEVNGPVTLKTTIPPYRWRWQRMVAAETLEAARPAMLTLINRTYITAMVTTEHLIGRLQEATEQTREQILGTCRSASSSRSLRPNQPLRTAKTTAIEHNTARALRVPQTETGSRT